MGCHRNGHHERKPQRQLLTLNETISVYRYSKTEDGFAGYTETVVLQTDAPAFAHIKDDSGSDGTVADRTVAVGNFTIECNYKNTFTWYRDMYVVSRFGLLQIVGPPIEAKRLRRLRLSAVLVYGITALTYGGGSVGGLLVVYVTLTGDQTSVILGAGIGRNLIAFDRDGVGKEPKTTATTKPEQVLWDSTTGTVTCHTGDTFFNNEILTFWLQ